MKKRSRLLFLFPQRVTGALKWLLPGIGIKRWIGLGSFGVILVVIGSSHLQSDDIWLLRALDTAIIASGIIILILGVKHMIRSFIAAVIPVTKEGELVDLLYQRRHLSRGPNVVCIGGGTGLSALLSGLKEFTSNITAIVTVADDGGSSGRLRQQFDILPPGDIRNCLVALADAPALLRDLFQFRFDKSSELSGHSFGNLFITAMTRVTGDFEKALKETSRVLALRGQVVPSTLNNVVLVAHHKDGSVTEGEEKIPKVRRPIGKVLLKPEGSVATPEALRAIRAARLIVLGPGSLYTSIIPNLLIQEITDALVASEAVKIYVCNIMTQPGETDSFSASDHIRRLLDHSHPHVFDYCLVNAGEIPAEVRRRYAEDSSIPVQADVKNIRGMGYRVIEENTVFIDNGVVRHDPAKLARIIFGVIDEL